MGYGKFILVVALLMLLVGCNSTNSPQPTDDNLLYNAWCMKELPSRDLKIRKMTQILEECINDTTCIIDSCSYSIRHIKGINFLDFNGDIYDFKGTCRTIFEDEEVTSFFISITDEKFQVEKLLLYHNDSLIVSFHWGKRDPERGVWESGDKEKIRGKEFSIRREELCVIFFSDVYLTKEDVLEVIANKMCPPKVGVYYFQLRDAQERDYYMSYIKSSAKNPQMQDLLTDYKKNRAWYVRKTDSGVSLDEIK